MPTPSKIYYGSTLIYSPALSDQQPSTLLEDGIASHVRGNVSPTASSTAHQWGAWVEVDASLSADAAGVTFASLVQTGASSTNTSTLLQIGAGAAGFETVVATIGIGYRHVFEDLRVPCRLDSGSRVAVRVQSAVSLKAVPLFVGFFTPKSVEPGIAVTYGADTSTSHGVTLSAPGLLNTKGAWTEIVASTSSQHSLLGVYGQGAGGTAMNGVDGQQQVFVDIGVGDAGSETVVVSNVMLTGSNAEVYRWHGPSVYGVDIPSGSRLSARYQRGAGGNAVDLILVGA